MITLLNGETWNKEEIITQMYDDTFYYGHLGKHALSSSSLKMILTSPKTYRNVTKYGDPGKTSPALEMGKLIHWMVLEPQKVNDIKFIDASSRATKIYKEAKQTHGEVFLQKDRSAAERITDAVLRNDQAVKLLNKSEVEVPVIDILEGLPFRGKADIIQGDTIIDLKTTADLSSFKYSADKYGYDLQAYMYLRLFKKQNFKFLVVDKASTDMGVCGVCDVFDVWGVVKFFRAVENYKYFFEAGNDLDQYVMTGLL